MSYPVKSYMSRDIATVGVNDSAVATSKLMMEKGVDYLIVLEKGQPTGIVTDQNLVLKIMAKERDPSQVKVSEIMSQPLITIDPDATVEEAVETMVQHGIRRLPVVREDIIYGMFTTRDLAKHFNDYERQVSEDIIRSMSMFTLPF
jgi:CBS domain-containing protein